MDELSQMCQQSDRLPLKYEIGKAQSRNRKREDGRPIRIVTSCEQISPAASAWLDWIRALAAIEVFAGHLRSFSLGDFSSHGGHVPLVIKIFYHITSLGHAAVVVFFVLSGCLVGGSVLNEFRVTGGLSAKKYVVARVARIHSVLIPALVLGGLADWIGMNIVHASEVYEHAHFDFSLGQNVAEQLSLGTFVANVACLQTIFKPVLGSNSPLWSLANEFWYYFLFPALLMAFWPHKSWRQRIISGVLASGIIWLLGADRIVYFLFWLAGVGVRLIPVVRTPPCWVGLAFFGGTLIATRTSLRVFIGDIGMDGLVAAGCSVMLWNVIQRPARMMVWLEKLGKQLASSSYTLYACHFPLAALTAALLMQCLGWTLPGDVLNLRAWVVYIGFLLVVGGVCFGISLLTERKHHQLKRWLTKTVLRS